MMAKIVVDGLWRNNPALIQLLGLCPLLAVTTSFVNGLSLGIATLFVLTLSNLAVSICAPFISSSIRLPVYVLLISSLVTCVELGIQAISFELYYGLGIFLPLIVTNCTILGRAEGFAARNHPLAALVDGISHGCGFALVLVLVGSLREILGTGMLFHNVHLLLGKGDFLLNIDGYDGFLLMILPPGGFILMGFLIAAKNIVEDYGAQRQKNKIITAGSKRVRVTG